MFSNRGGERSRAQHQPEEPGLRLRPFEALAVVTVLALAVAASWPALGVLIDGSTAAAAAAATPSPTRPAPVPGYSPPPVVIATPPSTPTSPTTTPGHLTLTVAAPSYTLGAKNPLWDTVAADFQAANPDITVHVEQDITASMPTSSVSLGGPDLMVGVPTDTFSGHDLSTFYSAAEIAPPGNDILPNLTYLENAVGQDGKTKQIGVPFLASTFELFYNKKIFAQARIARPPTTWSELITDATKAKAVGKGGFGLALGSPDTLTTLQLWAHGNGGGLMNAAKTTWTVNQPANVDTLQWLETNLIGTDLSEFGKSSTIRSQMVFFAEEDTGMLIADSGLIKQTEAGKLGTAFGVARIPGRNGPMTYSLGTVDDLIATKVHPENKAAIAQFVAFLLKPKYQKAFADAAGRLPVTRAGIAAESQNATLRPFLDALPTVDWLPRRAPGWTPLENFADNALDAINAPKSFLDHAQALATGGQ